MTYQMTREGYKKAREYLKRIGKLEEFNKNSWSTDGYSLIYFANACKDKKNELSRKS